MAFAEILCCVVQMLRQGKVWGKFLMDSIWNCDSFVVDKVPRTSLCEAADELRTLFNKHVSGDHTAELVCHNVGFVIASCIVDV